jgi:hypothetical protein
MLMVFDNAIATTMATADEVTDTHSFGSTKHIDVVGRPHGLVIDGDVDGRR